MYKELSISNSIPEKRLRSAVKTGNLSLTKADLAGSGATLHLHPESYDKVMRAKKAGKGSRVKITKHEIQYPMEANGGSMQARVWNGIKSAWK
ncbi:hypothetical protein PHYSODRAFT_386283, partial [Phytophthora sojae]